MVNFRIAIFENLLINKSKYISSEIIYFINVLSFFLKEPSGNPHPINTFLYIYVLYVLCNNFCVCWYVGSFGPRIEWMYKKNK